MRRLVLLLVLVVSNESFGQVAKSGESSARESGSREPGSRCRIIREFLDQYHRPFTVLELGIQQAYYAPAIAQRYDCTSIAVITDEAWARMLSTVAYESGLENLAIANPHEISDSMLERVGRCEHFDVVIVHDFEFLGSRSGINVLQLLCGLGDYLFIDLPSDMLRLKLETSVQFQVLIEEYDTAFCLFEIHKKELTMTRWTNANPEQLKKYLITSTFSEKKLYKQVTNTTTPWLKGINLITFIMLRGVYPTDDMIRADLKALKNVEHNDLVIGNILVQGSHLMPIDFGDQRRKVDSYRCIQAARKVFRFNRRFRDPQGTLARYTNYVASLKP